eukprot:CAMPEP_0198671700 /NCGR_PEP_ID=MMETSP1467-20131203/87358_1 /TAXON_ID=1462469 /ORGANISM="unid. sp., Strain CCMP2135" /LENGTH=41 /DNA_ID= /DNA_START= /DNA_END= /DNA_ORIENTATION=
MSRDDRAADGCRDVLRCDEVVEATSNGAESEGVPGAAPVVA